MTLQSSLSTAEVAPAENSTTPIEDFSIEINATSIMLVDDSVVLRDRLMEAFQERGFRVSVASNCDEAVQVFRENPTELAVVDLRMPGRTGLTLIPELKAISPSVKIVILSGFGSMATAIDAIRLGATNFIPKPADVDDILLAFVRGDSEVQVKDEPVDLQAPTLAQAEWEHIHRILADCNNNISEAARRLGIHRRSLQRKLRKRAP
jgi:two-component system, response regulator RegA